MKNPYDQVSKIACPHCGEIEDVFLSPHEGDWAIVCGGCGMVGPEGSTREMASKAWHNLPRNIAVDCSQDGEYLDVMINIGPEYLYTPGDPVESILSMIEAELRKQLPEQLPELDYE